MTNKLLTGPVARPAPTDHPVLELLRARWSPRAFAPEAIDAATLTLLLEAARWAPSASNEQPWGFIYAHRSETADFARILDCINPGNQVWAKDAAVLLITTARQNRRGKDQVNVTASYDLGQAVAHLSIQATALGIAVHQMGGFSNERAQQSLSVPAGHRCVTAVALGYPGDPAALPEDLRVREANPRTRVPLASIAFQGQWRGAD